MVSVSYMIHSLWAGRSGVQIPVWGIFFRNGPDGPCDPLNLLFHGYRVFSPGGKATTVCRGLRKSRVISPLHQRSLMPRTVFYAWGFPISSIVQHISCTRTHVYGYRYNIQRFLYVHMRSRLVAELGWFYSVVSNWWQSISCTKFLYFSGLAFSYNSGR